MQSEIVSNKYKNPDTIFLFKYIIKGSTMCVFIILSFFFHAHTKLSCHTTVSSSHHSYNGGGGDSSSSRREITTEKREELLVFYLLSITVSS